MDFLLPKKLTLLFLIISALLISTSYAGRQPKSLTRSYAEDFVGAIEDLPLVEDGENVEISIVEERKLINTQDYGGGGYDNSSKAPIKKPGHKLVPGGRGDQFNP